MSSVYANHAQSTIYACAPSSTSTSLNHKHWLKGQDFMHRVLRSEWGQDIAFNIDGQIVELSETRALGCFKFSVRFFFLSEISASATGALHKSTFHNRCAELLLGREVRQSSSV